jgi:predicted Zn-dependent peptidase
MAGQAGSPGVETTKRGTVSPDGALIAYPPEAMGGAGAKGGRGGSAGHSTNGATGGSITLGIVDPFAGQIVVSVAGNFEHARLIDLLESAFGRLSRSGRPKLDTAPSFHRAVTVRKKQLEQVQVCLGCKGLRYTHEDRFVVMALNTILGNSMSSRLFQEVREQNALAYAIYSYVTAYRDAGLLTVYAGTDPANTVQAIQLIVRELRKIRDEGITPAEEVRVKNQIKGNLVLSLETSNSHMGRIARQEIYFGKYLSVDDIIRTVDKVTAEQVQGLARTLFTHENLSLSILGPLSRADVPDSLLEI